MKPSQGSLLVIFGKSAIGLEFGRDSDEAERIRAGLLKAGGRNWPVGAKANVAYLWNRRTKKQVATVLGCLKA